MAPGKIAKVHSHHTQRAKPRDGAGRKAAFKGTLDNPHRVPWPFVPVNVQNSILENLVDLLSGVAEYHRARSSNTKKRKGIPEAIYGPPQSNSKTQITRGNSDNAEEEPRSEGPPILLGNAVVSEPPSILKSLTYGINAVTKRLETQIANCRLATTLKSPNESQATEEPNLIRYIFVCRADVDPPILIDHLPHLVATYNVLRRSNALPMVLIPLPKDAEATLARAMGVRRLAALAIDGSSVAANERLATANMLPLVTAPWFSQPTRYFVQTHIKHVRTTAPRDMKAAKEARMRAKSAAKTHRSSLKTTRNS